MSARLYSLRVSAGINFDQLFKWHIHHAKINHLSLAYSRQYYCQLMAFDIRVNLNR